MQDEAGAKGLSPLLEKHWEKIVLVVVALAFLIFLGAKFSGGGNTAGKGLKEAEGIVAKRKGTENTSLEKPKVLAQVDPVPTPPPFSPPARTVGNPTVHKVDPKRAPKGPAAAFFFPKLTLSAPNAGFDGVEFEWSLSGAPDKDEKPAPIVVPPSTFFFVIEKRKKGDKEWTTIEKEAKGDSKTGNGKYIDDKASPKTEYEYKVTLGSTDPKYVRENPSRLTDKIGGPAYVTTPGIWKVSFDNFTPEDIDAVKPATVFVKVTKYDSEAGEVSWSKIHKNGQPLGADDTGNFVHSVYSPKKGRTVQVDFKMGGKIAKIVTDKLVPHTIQVCSPKTDAAGGRTCEGPKPESRPYRVNEVTFTDEEGKTQTVRRESGAPPAADQLCEDHGGAPIQRGPTPEERAAKAVKLLQDADTFWNSNERKKAQELYKTLLATYGESEAVKARKNEIAERSTQKLD